MLNYEVLEIMLFALLGGVEPPLMHMVRFENLKQCFLELQRMCMQLMWCYKNVVMFGILFGNNDSAFGDAFVQLGGIWPTHSMWLALKTQ